MAKIFPILNPFEIKNDGEKVVYESLRKQLPDHWIVRYSLNFCLELENYLNDGEIDFIVMAPEYGLMFIEVKEFNEFNELNGIWYCVDQNGKKIKKDPFRQVVKGKHVVINHFCKLLKISKQNFPGVYGHLVIFPNSESKGPNPSTYDPNIFINRNGMNKLEKLILNAFEAWNREDLSSKFSCYFNKIEDFLIKDPDFVPVGAMASDAEKTSIEELTKMQYESFRAILSNKRVHVKGPAGTGKTILAMWAATTLANRKNKVLYICYNNLLASWIKTQNENRIFDIFSFFDLCKIKVRKYECGIFKAEKNETDFFENRAVKMMIEAAGKMTGEEKYDAVFVDEAQDFDNSWWEVIFALMKNKENGALYLFYDPEQKLFRNGQNNFPDGMLCELDKNCRNTRKISDFCGKAIQKDFGVFQFSPEGIFPDIIPAIQKPADRARKIIETVSKWLADGYLASQIAVISPWASKNEKNSFKYLDKISGVRLESGDDKIDDWIKGEAILTKTIKSFKGLEVDCLVITDIPKIGVIGFSEQDLYVAASRAKSRLVIIPVSQDAEEYLKNNMKNRQGR